jgi:hypothetical protein
VAVGSGTIHRFALSDDRWQLVSRTHCPSITALSYASAHRSLIVGDQRGYIHKLDLQQNRLGTICHLKRSIRTLICNDLHIYGVTDDSDLRVVRINSMQGDGTYPVFQTENWDAYTVAAHPQLHRAALAGFGAYIRFVRFAPMSHSLLPTSFGHITKLMFLAECRLLCAVGNNGIEFWNIDYAQPFFVDRLTTDVKIRAVREAHGELLLATL